MAKAKTKSRRKPKKSIIIRCRDCMTKARKGKTYPCRWCRVRVCEHLKGNLINGRDECSWCGAVIICDD